VGEWGKRGLEVWTGRGATERKKGELGSEGKGEAKSRGAKGGCWGKAGGRRGTR